MNLSEKRRSEIEEEWIERLLSAEFFGICMKHKYVRKNEKNVFCIDCNVEICRHCCKSSTESHFLHRRLQICKYVYQDVLRLVDIQHYFDCSHIQTYKINGEKAIHLNSRPQAKDARRPSTKSKNAASCLTCQRYIQDHPNRFCSISCKISSPSKKHKFGFSSKMEHSILEKEDSNNQEGSSEEKKSCTSSLTQVSEESEILLSHFSLRPLLRILKRKGISRRSSLF